MTKRLEVRTMDFKHIFGRNKQSSAPEKRGKLDKPSTAGAHELSLEYEGFLSPSRSRPPKRSTPTTRLAPPQVPEKTPEIKRNECIFRDRRGSCDKSLKSSLDVRGEIDGKHSQPKRTPSRWKNGLFSLSRPTRVEQRNLTNEYPKSSRANAPELEDDGRSSTHGWFRRCMSTTSRAHHPSPPPSFVTIPPYYGPQISDDGEYTALPALPGYESESPRPPGKLPSGAAARAAAAAQNEVLDAMHNLRLAEPKLTRDSESGVGIELRDHAEVVTDLDVPVVRKGRTIKTLLYELLTEIQCRSFGCATRGTRGPDIVLSRLQLIDQR